MPCHTLPFLPLPYPAISNRTLLRYTCGADDDERLSGEEVINDAANGGGDEAFHGAEIAVSRLAHHAAEGDDRRQTSEIPKEMKSYGG